MDQSLSNMNPKSYRYFTTQSISVIKSIAIKMKS